MLTPYARYTTAAVGINRESVVYIVLLGEGANTKDTTPKSRGLKAIHTYSIDFGFQTKLRVKTNIAQGT